MVGSFYICETADFSHIKHGDFYDETKASRFPGLMSSIENSNRGFSIFIHASHWLPENMGRNRPCGFFPSQASLFLV